MTDKQAVPQGDVQVVADDCVGIVWRNRYYSLPIIPRITREALIKALGGEEPANMEQFIAAINLLGAEVLP